MTIRRAFTSENQLAFARLSGDCNPLHIDPQLARRLMFGGPVVHGLHALLWGLDAFFKPRRQLRLHTLKAVFYSAMAVGEAVHCAFEAVDDRRVEIILATEATTAAGIQASWGPADQSGETRLPTAPPAPEACLERTIDEAAAASGSLPLYLDRELAKTLFPNLLRVLPPMQLAAVLAGTRLVGMECPGLHSIFSEIDLTFVCESGGKPVMDYRVPDCNKRLSLLTLAVEAPGMKGKIKALFRPGPLSQAAYTQIRTEVDSDEFSEQRALIVGGSRGLGEVTAKLLAAGGAEVIVTYYRGGQDTQCMVEEMVSRGAKADCFPLNVLDPPVDLLREVASLPKPLFLYYFATPFIFGAAKGKFSLRRFDLFCDYYVTGFLRTVEALSLPSGSLRRILYPSTTAVEQVPLDMGEYAAAKSAGELLCDFLQKAYPGLVVYRPRLPRLATDQTVSLLPVPSQDPLPILLSHLRRLQEI